MASPGFQRRCVTLDDYRTIAEEMEGVRAVAPRRMNTGSWETIYLHVQREKNRKITPSFISRLFRYMEPTLLINSTIEILPPEWVSLDIQLTVWLADGVHPESFRVGLAQDFEGFANNSSHFHRDSFSFGQNVYLSEVTTWAMELPGVDDVRIDTFQRWGEPPDGELERGQIVISPLEIARIENDPTAPQNGILAVRIAEAP